MLKTILDSKILRFGLAGVLNTSLDLLILNTLVFVFKVPALVANLVSAIICISQAYFVNHYFVFRHKHGHTVQKFLRFFGISGFSLLIISTLTIYAVLALFNHNQQTFSNAVQQFGLGSAHAEALKLNIAKLISVAVTMVWNFLLYRALVFKHPEEAEDDIVVA